MGDPFTLPFTGFAIYSWLPGQGGTPLANTFDLHQVIGFAGLVYDPSYGEEYTDSPFELRWEDASVESFGPPPTPDQKGVQETSWGGRTW